MPRLNEQTVYDQYQKQINSICDIHIRAFVETLWKDALPKTQNGKITTIDKRKRKRLFAFGEAIGAQYIENLTWNRLCKIVENAPFAAPGVCKLLCFLLENNLYLGDHKEKLSEIKECFTISTMTYSTSQHIFNYDEIEKLYYFRPNHLELGRKYNGPRFIFINFEIKSTRELLFIFFAQDNPGGNSFSYDFYTSFGESLGNDSSEINNSNDFNYSTYQTQLDFFLKSNLKNVKDIILVLKRFYIYLSDILNVEVFKKTDNIEINFLKRKDYAQRMIDNFEPIYYNPYAPIPKSNKWILHINGNKRNGTSSNATTTKVFDFEQIDSLFYRKLVKQFIWENDNMNFGSKYFYLYNLQPILNFISNFKKKLHFPNPKEDHFNIQEIVLLQNWINKTIKNNGQKNLLITKIKNFIGIQQKQGNIKLEDLALEYLNEYPRNNLNSALAIPDFDLEKINSIMLKHLNDSYRNQLCYAIFHFCLQTEFRISQICNLNVNCIVPTLKVSQYKIVTTSKTSNGQTYTSVISDITKAHLDEIIQNSEKIRSECTNENVSHYLFLHKGDQNKFKPIDAQIFRTFLSKCCTEAGIKNYTPGNLRDTHMTKAEEYRMRNDDNDAVLSVLSGHRHVDTTHNHYIQTQLIKMLESTFGIIIGDIDINGNIVEKIADAKILNLEHTTEQGCGYCRLEQCEVHNGISCLLCKDFITTLEHQSDFENALLKIDNIISSAPTLHDKEDLQNIKRLFAAYLLQIMKLKVENNAKKQSI